ncbi:LOW QUALITY PROTEIN: hypothetical protein V2J09_016669 [Rumex salicifolius]
MPIVDDFGTYLGIPTSIGCMPRAKYQFLLDKISNRLHGWNARSLSLADKVTKANSVLMSIPLYSMQTNYLLRLVCDSIDKIIKGFGCTSKRRRIHLLSRDKIALPKVDGGFDLHPMSSTRPHWKNWGGVPSKSLTLCGLVCSAANTAMVGPLLISSPATATPCEFGKGWFMEPKPTKQGMRSSIGNGNTTLFWDHAWLMLQPLGNLVTSPILEAFSSATVSELCTPDGWNWEVLNHLLLPIICHQITSICVDPSLDAADKIFWGESTSGLFTCKSILKLLCGESPHMANYGIWRRIY